MSLLLRFLRPFHWRVALAILLGAAVVASNMGLLGAAAYLIATASATHLLIFLLVPMYLVRLLSITRGLARYAERLMAHDVTLRILARLRVWLYDGLGRLGPAVTQTLHSGDTLGRLMGDVDEMQNGYLLLVSPFAVAILIGAVLIGVLHLFDDTLALAVAIIFIAAGLGLPVLIWVLSRGLGHRSLAARAELSTALVDSIQGAQDILSHDYAGRQLQHVNALAGRIRAIDDRTAMITGAREGVADLLGNAAVLIALALSIILVANRSMPALYLAVPALLVLAAYEAVRPLGAAAQSYDRVHAAGTRLRAIGERKPVVVERDGAPPRHVTGSLNVDHVTLVYPGARQPALLDVTCAIPVGARIAVVGASGAGKTSLAQLVLRSWDPTSGVVSLDGMDLRDYRLTDLHSGIGMVSQETHIFDDTIGGNLRLARPEATERQLLEALEAAQLSELLQSLPAGLETPLGERGTRLSGGERQRLAIARALLKDAPILILYEPTANLDPRTEHAVLTALHTLMDGRTTLLITHRLVMMDRMDQILVLDRGRIVERGTDRQLRAHGSLYAAMLEAQDGMVVPLSPNPSPLEGEGSYYRKRCL